MTKDKEKNMEELEKDVQLQEKTADVTEDPSAQGSEDKQDASSKKKTKKPSKEQQLKDELAATKEQMMRILAEYDNYRKRSEKERTCAVGLGTELAVEKLIPVLDTLEMAAAAKTDDTDYKKGVEMTVALFITALHSLGVKEICALGNPFDPHLHDAVMTEEKEGCACGQILRVMQKGYQINDRVLRPSLVVVSA